MGGVCPLSLVLGASPGGGVWGWDPREQQGDAAKGCPLLLVSFFVLGVPP